MTELVSNKITIKNFVVIKEAEIDIKDINIIIGPQANGKSLIAKLIYFFDSLSKVFVQFAQKEMDKNSLDEDVIKRFNTFFPSYLWKDNSFNIQYVLDDVEISFSYKKGTKKNAPIFDIFYSEKLIESLNAYKAEIDKASKKFEIKTLGISYKTLLSFRDVKNTLKGFHPNYFGRFTFIPSGRSFFSALKGNVFSLLSESIKIDPFINEFGSSLTRTKTFFSGEISENVDDFYKKYFRSIVMGDYVYDEKEEEDWIVSQSGLRTKLSDASSGQQEALPMLAALTVEPVIMNALEESGMIFIEEPEAHLFPTAQGDVMSLISSLHEQYSTRFFMTSHSPYIISALNNMILANEVIENGMLTNEEFSKLNKGGASISFRKVSAYTIEDGVAKSIMDNEHKMIGAYKLDDISNHFQKVQNELLMLED